jgi:predicted RNA binding protein YcfA (HicA-like mRNA interferase family)
MLSTKGATVNKEIRDIVKKLEKQGWRIEQGGKHLKAYPADKSMPLVVIPGTPSDHRSLKNLIAQLRRSGADI